MGGGEERVGGGEADAWGVLVVVVAVWGLRCGVMGLGLGRIVYGRVDR